MMTMATIQTNPNGRVRQLVAWVILLSILLVAPVSMFGKKKKDADAPKPAPVIDYSNIVWPNPPAVARIRYQAFYAAEKLSQVDAPKTKKDSWMDRLPGTPPLTDDRT